VCKYSDDVIKLLLSEKKINRGVRIRHLYTKKVCRTALWENVSVYQGLV
jgi:hypothetical protein